MEQVVLVLDTLLQHGEINAFYLTGHSSLSSA
jgi:hypothetical protein